MSNQLGWQALFLPEMQEPGLQPCAAFSFDLLSGGDASSRRDILNATKCWGCNFVVTLRRTNIVPET